jgi:hypothetical protein
MHLLSVQIRAENWVSRDQSLLLHRDLIIFLVDCVCRRFLCASAVLLVHLRVKILTYWSA